MTVSMELKAPARLHALDATRAFALLLGVVLHASMSFFMPIPAQDASQSSAMAVSFYVIHMFRMTLFFLIAGLFARLLLERRGARGFIADRSKRIGLPMIVGWLVLAPATIGAVIFGLARSFPDGVPPELAALPAPQGLPLIHLWFLYVLCGFYLAALAVRGLSARVTRPGSLSRVLDAGFDLVLRFGLAPLILALPIAAALLVTPAYSPWFGIPTPDHGLLPNLGATVAFSLAFAFGWQLQRRLDRLESIARLWPLYLVAAATLTAGCLWMVGLMPPAGVPSARLADGNTPLYTLAYAAAAWCWALGLLGAALRFLHGESRLRRYLADSAYWVYLLHLPVVFWLQGLMAPWPLHWSIKFVLIITVTLALCLGSFALLVRRTRLAALLDGRRPRQATSAASPAAPSNIALSLSGVHKRFGEQIALAGVDLQIQRGEVLALLGANGAGKSTLAALALGLQTPDQGEVQIDGASPLHSRARLRVGVMLQDVQLCADLTPRELLRQTAGYYPAPLGVDEAIVRSGIESIADRRYRTLSGGQKRQAQFALAMIGQPQLLILDEPSVALDAAARSRLWQTLKDFRDQGGAVLLTTHYLEEAEALADRVVVLAKGRVVASGSVEEMRGLVARRQVRCATQLPAEQISAWPEVIEARREQNHLHIIAGDAEQLVRRLLDADPALRGLEVRAAGLGEVMEQLTGEAA